MHASLKILSKMLRNLHGWLDQARTYAAERGFDADRLVTARLAPDQFSLVQQIQAACDSAKFAPARVTGESPPSHADEETTLDELSARIAAVAEYLDGFDAARFDGAETRKIRDLRMLNGGWVYGGDYFYAFAVPNFFHHLNMAYAILRHNGVPLGKRGYLGHLPIHHDHAE